MALLSRVGLFHFAEIHQQLLDICFTLYTGSIYRRIKESLLALALVEPTQYVTHDVSIPDT